MKLHIMPLLLSSIVAVVGCGENDVTQTTLDAVIITTSKQSYLRGEQIRLTLKNTSDQAVFINGCFGELRNQDTIYKYPILYRGCVAELRVSEWRRFGPGEVVSDSLATAIGFPAGPYRMVYNVRVDTLGAPRFDGNVPSNVFALQ